MAVILSKEICIKVPSKIETQFGMSNVTKHLLETVFDQ